MATFVTGSKYLNAEFDQLVNKLLAEWKVMGAAVAVIDGHDICTKGYGYTRPDGGKITEETLFNCASMSKSFTACAVALLVDDKEGYPHVRWDTPASELIREDFVLADPYYTANVTIEDLLCHRTGMSDHEDADYNVDNECPDTAKSVTRKLRHLPLDKPLRTHYQYNNTMFVAASYIVEAVSGQSFSDILKHRFWEPIGMKDTYLALSRAPPEHNDRLATGFAWDKKKEAFVELVDSNAPNGQGCGSIMSNAKDWAQWVHAMIHKTTGISAESHAALTRIRMLASDKEKYMRPFQSPLFYGLGLHIEYYRGYTVISHSGGVPGFISHMCWIPEKQWGYVMFQNTSDGTCIPDVLCWVLIDELLRVPKYERTDWLRLAREQDIEEEAEEEGQTDQERGLFPDRAEPPLPLQLPLSAYTGTYSHPAYREFSLTIKDGQLFADATNRTFGFFLTWEHVSANSFVAVKEDQPKFTDHGARFESVFEVGASGKVERMGLDFLDEDDSDYFWFDRVD